MEKIIPIKKLIFVSLIIGAFFFVIIDVFAEKTEELQSSNQMLKQENNQLESRNNYINSKPVVSKQNNGYTAWRNLEKVAESLVKESNGKFKKSWGLYLAKESQKYGIDPFMVYELLNVETGGKFNPNLIGPPTDYGRAYGLGQFMKNTAPWVADMADLPYKKELLMDPYYSMQLSLVYLDFLYKEYGNWDEALTAYHRGIGGLEQYKENNGHARSWYAKKIQTSAKSHQTVASVQ